jgi:hypothetical protein
MRIFEARRMPCAAPETHTQPGPKRAAAPKLRLIRSGAGGREARARTTQLRIWKVLLAGALSRIGLAPITKKTSNNIHMQNPT